ncbi:hypothetical protein [Aquitalea sp. LB_tupeE]|uniref:hypothetical protein n=1 Tax=Aquitalea sp. LB_tupeE TaxID=2748078 RepID=UPI0015BA8247|nr:hypothetical protein [Aquitalea sp. LB_tupeE]NWK78148.1 hypothetical protein [Aquitalea sp. LB_tupeE]
MNRELEIVEQLILGQDPLHRGQALHTPKDPALDQARAHYYQQLKRVSKQHAAEPAQPSQPARCGQNRAGERWSIAEDNRLSALWETSATVTSAELADKLGRSRTAILARLVKQGYFADQASAMQADDQRLEQAGQPAWWATQPKPAMPATTSATPPRPPAHTTQGSGPIDIPNAGKAWSASDDARLRANWHDPASPNCASIAQSMGRSRAAIIARLVRIGEFPDRDAVRAADRERGSNLGQDD